MITLRPMLASEELDPLSLGMLLSMSTKLHDRVVCRLYILFGNTDTTSGCSASTQKKHNIRLQKTTESSVFF